MSYLKKMRTAILIVATLVIFANVIDAKADDREIDLGGFIKVNAALTTKGVNGIDDASGVYNADLLFAQDNKGSRFGFNAKETRLFAGITQKNTPVGAIKGYVEGNFGVESNADGNTVEAYGTSNARFVLRHAYVEVGNDQSGRLLVGQAYSTFMDLKGAMDVLDYAGSAAVVFARQPQIRYTLVRGDTKLMIAAENATSNLGYNLVTDDQRLPDFVARVDYDPTWGHFSVAAILREIRIDNNEFDARKITGGVAVTASKKIIGDRFEITGQYIRGAIGHYGAFSAFSDGVIMTDEQGASYIEPTEIQGMSIAATIVWSEKLNSIVMASYAANTNKGANVMTLGTGHAIENVKSLHANLNYNITDDLKVGFEYKKLIGNLSDNTKPNVDRYQGSMIYHF